MNRHRSLSPRAKLGIGIAAIIVIFVLFPLIAMFIWHHPQSTSSSTINNYTHYVKNVPSSEQALIQKALATTLKQNNVTRDPSDIKDIAIRSGSYSQTPDTNGVKVTKFIVDIPSLKQSYLISDRSSLSDTSYSQNYDYTVMALCLRQETKKYDFTCKDRLSVEDGLPYADITEDILPYTASYFMISLDGYNTSNHKINLKVLTMTDTTNTSTDAVQTQYEQDAQQWLMKKGITLENYNLEYN